MKFTALTSQPTFSLFSEKTFFEKIKIGQLFLSIFEIFKIESQMKKTYLQKRLFVNSRILTYLFYYLTYCSLLWNTG